MGELRRGGEGYGEVGRNRERLKGTGSGVEGQGEGGGKGQGEVGRDRRW